MAQQQRTISQVVSTYRDQLTNFTHETLNGSMDAVDMRRAHNALVRQLGPQAYYEGLREGGIPAEEADSADKAAIADWVRGQLSHVNQFAADTVAARGDDGKRAGIMGRLGLWIDSMQTVGNLGVMSAKKNKMGTWRLGNTERHCRTCNGLHGKRHRLSWYSSRGLVPREPGNDMLECKGYKCLCSISDDEGNTLVPSMRAVRFDPSQPRDEEGKWTDTGAGDQDDIGSQNGNIISNSLGEYTSDDDADTIQETASDMLLRLQENDPDRFNEDSEEFVNNTLYDWSQDNNLGKSKYLQLAASKEFGIPLSDYTKKILGAEVNTFAASSYRAILRDSYEETQGWLRSHGIGENS